MIVSTDELKEHLGLAEIDIEEAILSRCLAASIEYCELHNETTYTNENLPSTVRIAILMLAAHLFNNREATTEKLNKQIEFGVSSLLNISREKFSC